MPQRPMAWPIGKADLDPYQAAAAEILDLPLAEQPDDLPMGLGGARFRDIRFQHSAPTRFGQKYRDEIAASPRIAACLNANLVDLTLDADLASVTAAHFRSYDPADPGFAVRARVFCLALGGLENPRMLLNFTRQRPQGIGNDHDLVGRHFCEHPSRSSPRRASATRRRSRRTAWRRPAPSCSSGGRWASPSRCRGGTARPIRCCAR